MGRIIVTELGAARRPARRRWRAVGFVLIVVGLGVIGADILYLMYTRTVP